GSDLAAAPSSGTEQRHRAAAPSSGTEQRHSSDDDPADACEGRMVTAIAVLLKTQFRRTSSAMAANNSVPSDRRLVKGFLTGGSDFCCSDEWREGGATEVGYNLDAALVTGREVNPPPGDIGAVERPNSGHCHRVMRTGHRRQ